MTYWRLLLRAEARALAALFICCGVAAFVYAVSMYFDTRSASYAGELFMLFILGSIIYGLLPTMVYGAPLYALLQRWRKLNWAIVILLGALPGIATFLLDTVLAIVLLVFGLAVSGLMHFLARDDSPDAL